MSQVMNVYVALGYQKNSHARISTVIVCNQIGGFGVTSQEGFSVTKNRLAVKPLDRGHLHCIRVKVVGRLNTDNFTKQDYKFPFSFLK